MRSATGSQRVNLCGRFAVLTRSFPTNQPFGLGSSWTNHSVLVRNTHALRSFRWKLGLMKSRIFAMTAQTIG